LWDTDGPYWNLKGNGGVLSTLDDLYRWNRAMRGERILPETWKKKMYTPYVPEGPRAKSHYGYGWVIVPTIRGTRLITHNGGNGIFFDEVRNYIDEDVVVITASTTASHSIQTRTRELLTTLFPRAKTPGQKR
jgi:CubicO group peptidase (beta-lactamase class C family)